MTTTIELFDQNPKILAKYQRKWKYILVDEYQDTNHAQYMIIKMLAGKYRNLCVVGDDWQSIYSWRGATMRNILDFEKDYPEAVTILLEQNYRSTSNILDASHALIQKNQSRTDKKLWTDAGEGEKIKIWTASDERDESSMVAKEIQKLLLSHERPSYKDFAILYRTNAQSRVLEEAMMRHGIPYRVVGGVKFYSRKEIKDVISYLRLIINPADTVSLLRVINTPPRKIGAKTLEQLQNLARERGEAPIYSVLSDIEGIRQAGMNDGKLKTLNHFVKLISGLQEVNQKFPASGVIKHLIQDSGYKEFLLDGTPEGETRFENVQELISVASKYDSLEPGVSLATFLEEVSLISDLDQMDDQDNAVTMMTLHSAKGLEFPTVFICGLEEGVCPHSRSLFDPESLEEERRLAYVGITRAMQKLHLTSAWSRMMHGQTQYNPPSRFLDEIPSELIEEIGGTRMLRSRRDRSGGGRTYGGGGGSDIPTGRTFGGGDREQHTDDVVEAALAAANKPTPSGAESMGLKVGDDVRHNQWGEGVITDIEGTGDKAEASVYFPSVGEKRLLLSWAPLEKI